MSGQGRRELSPVDLARLHRVLRPPGFDLIFGPIKKKALAKLLKDLRLTTSSTPFGTDETIVGFALRKKFACASFLEGLAKEEKLELDAAAAALRGGAGGAGTPPHGPSRRRPSSPGKETRFAVSPGGGGAAASPSLSPLEALARGPPPSARDFPNLEDSPLDLQRLRKQAVNALKVTLGAHGGPTCLFLDPRLKTFIHLVCCGAATALADMGVAEVLFLDPAQEGGLDCSVLGSSFSAAVFIARPRPAVTELLAHYVRGVSRHAVDSGIALTSAAYFLPTPTSTTLQILRKAKARDLLSVVGSLDVHLCPIDGDVLSMMSASAGRELYVEGKDDVIEEVTAAIDHLQTISGRIPLVHTKGAVSNAVAERLQQRAGGTATSTGVRSPSAGTAGRHIDECVIIDRDVDLVSLLMTPLTYEALIDEFVGLDAGSVKVDETAVANFDSDLGDRKPFVRLTSNDRVFRRVRGMHFSAVPAELRNFIAKLEVLKKRKAPTADADAQVLKSFTDVIDQRFKLQESLQVHLHLSDRVSEHFKSEQFRVERFGAEQAILKTDSDTAADVDDLLDAIRARDQPLPLMLRMACIHSVVSDGLPRPAFDQLYEAMTTVYGWGVLLHLRNLAHVGLLTVKGSEKYDFCGTFLPSPTPFVELRDLFGLVSEAGMDVSAPQDVAYVTSGFAPLIAKIVECAMQGRWLSDAGVHKLRGPPPRTVRQRPDYHRPHHSRKTLLVFVAGPVSYLELAALRFVAAKSKDFNIVVGCTNLCHGRRFVIDSLTGSSSTLPTGITVDARRERVAGTAADPALAALMPRDGSVRQSLELSVASVLTRTEYARLKKCSGNKTAYSHEGWLGCHRVGVSADEQTRGCCLFVLESGGSLVYHRVGADGARHVVGTMHLSGGGRVGAFASPSARKANAAAEPDTLQLSLADEGDLLLTLPPPGGEHGEESNTATLKIWLRAIQNTFALYKLANGLFASGHALPTVHGLGKSVSAVLARKLSRDERRILENWVRLNGSGAGGGGGGAGGSSSSSSTQASSPASDPEVSPRGRSSTLTRMPSAEHLVRSPRLSADDTASVAAAAAEVASAAGQSAVSCAVIGRVVAKLRGNCILNFDVVCRAVELKLHKQQHQVGKKGIRMLEHLTHVDKALIAAYSFLYVDQHRAPFVLEQFGNRFRLLLRGSVVEGFASLAPSQATNVMLGFAAQDSCTLVNKLQYLHQTLYALSRTPEQSASIAVVEKAIASLEAEIAVVDRVDEHMMRTRSPSREGSSSTGVGGE